jgi:hypothetical protein
MKAAAMKDLLNDTRCKHCGQPFASVRVPVIGQQMRQFQEFTQGLQKHLIERHPEVYAQMAALSLEFNGMLLLNQFDITDDQLSKDQDVSRHRIFKLMQRVRVSDATIQKRVDRIFEEWCGPDAGITDIISFTGVGAGKADIIGLMKELRDVLGEIGLYPEPAVITVSGSSVPN